jgi:hypothetical protein
MPDWLRQTLSDRFIAPVRAADVLENDTSMLDPAGSLVPTLDSRERCDDLWDIANKVKEYFDRLPVRHETWEWVETLASWAGILQEEADSFNESLTLADVCTRSALKKITDLSLDRGIEDELKEIAESLGLGVRSTLVHPDVVLEEFIEFDERVESDVRTCSNACRRTANTRKRSVVPASGAVASITRKQTPNWRVATILRSIIGLRRLISHGIINTNATA